MIIELKTASLGRASKESTWPDAIWGLSFPTVGGSLSWLFCRATTLCHGPSPACYWPVFFLGTSWDWPLRSWWHSAAQVKFPFYLVFTSLGLYFRRFSIFPKVFAFLITKITILKMCIFLFLPVQKFKSSIFFYKSCGINGAGTLPFSTFIVFSSTTKPFFFFFF